MNRRQRRTWWATWPGALALGAGSLLLALPGMVTLIGTALLPAADSAGIDVEVAGPGIVVRIPFARVMPDRPSARIARFTAPRDAFGRAVRRINAVIFELVKSSV